MNVLKPIFSFFKTRQSEPYKIAVMTPANNMVVDSVCRGLIETLDHESPLQFVCDIYDAGRDMRCMREQSKRIVLSNYDLVFSLGLSCTLMAKEMALHQRRALPIVFGCVDDSLVETLVQPQSRMGRYITGISAGPFQARQQISLLCALKPSMRKALIAYDPLQMGGILEQRAQELASHLEKKGVDVQELTILERENVIQKIENVLGAQDVLIILRDDTILLHIAGLVELCNYYGVTLMTSDWTSVERGAALGYACSDYKMGVAGAHKIREIFEEGKKPHEIPVTVFADTFKMKVNKRTMKLQRLEIDERLLALIESSHLI